MQFLTSCATSTLSSGKGEASGKGQPDAFRPPALGGVVLRLPQKGHREVTVQILHTVQSRVALAQSAHRSPRAQCINLILRPLDGPRSNRYELALVLVDDGISVDCRARKERRVKQQLHRSLGSRGNHPLGPTCLSRRWSRLEPPSLRITDGSAVASLCTTSWPGGNAH